MKDYYHIIGVTPESSLDLIKATFRKKVMVLHPEKNTSPDAKEEFSDLVEAYAILSKPFKRKAYDTILQQQKQQVPMLIAQETEKTFETYQNEAKNTSRAYRDSTFAEFLALDLIVDLGINSIITGSEILENTGDLLDSAGDVLGDLFDFF